MSNLALSRDSDTSQKDVISGIFQPGMTWDADEGRFKKTNPTGDEQNDPSKEDQTNDEQKQEVIDDDTGLVEKNNFGLQANEYLKSQNKSYDQNSFHLIPKKVILAYGPYDVQGVYDLRTDRLHGLISALEKEGADVHLKPSYHINQVRIWHLGEVIFSCQIDDLPHGIDAGLVDETLSRKAVQVFKWNSQRAGALLQEMKPSNGTVDKCPCHGQDEKAIKRIPLPKK